MLNKSLNLNKTAITAFLVILLIGFGATATENGLSDEEIDTISAYLLENFNVAEELNSFPKGSSTVDGFTAVPLETVALDSASLQKGIVLGVFLYGEENRPYLLFSVTLPEGYSADHAAGLFSDEGEVVHVTEIERQTMESEAEIPSFALSETEGESSTYKFELRVGNKLLIGYVPAELD